MQRRTAALLVACAGSYLAFLDTTIVNTSFPDIAGWFPEAGRAELSWILDAYFIVLAALLVPAGGLADRLGRKRVFLAGLLAFVVTSVGCALAPSWEALVAARVLQGAAAAVLAPASLALVLPEFPPARRATAVGIWGAAAALAAASGPPLGGVLVEVADWRWIFLVNLPLGLAAYLVGRRVLRESRDEQATGLPDLPGAAVSALALGLLALGIVEGESWGWTSAGVLGSLGGAALLLVVLARRCVTHPRPIVDPALMRIASFRRGSARDAAVRRRLLLDDPREHPVPHLRLELLGARRRAGDRARPAGDRAGRRSGRPSRRPLRPPRGDRAGHRRLRRSACSSCAARVRSPTSPARGCRACCWRASASAWRSRRSERRRWPTSSPTASARRAR